MNKMSMNEEPVGGDPLTFTIIDKSPGSDLRLVCQAANEEVKENWVTQIRSILDMQGDFLKGERFLASLSLFVLIAGGS